MNTPASRLALPPTHGMEHRKHPEEVAKARKRVFVRAHKWKAYEPQCGPDSVRHPTLPVQRWPGTPAPLPWAEPVLRHIVHGPIRTATAAKLP
jgi:hypothetical protein